MNNFLITRIINKVVIKPHLSYFAVLKSINNTAKTLRTKISHYLCITDIALQRIQFNILISAKIEGNRLLPRLFWRARH